MAPSSAAVRTAQASEFALTGARAWLITDGKMGSDRLAEGVAAALGLSADLKHARPRAPFKWLAPLGPADPRDRVGQPGSQFAPPWPDIAIAVGRRSAPSLRAVRSAAKGGCFTVFLLDPRAGTGIADVIWVPEHDSLRGDNVITTPTGPHPFTPARLARLRAHVPPDIAALPRPRIAVLLGGRTKAYPFTDAEHDHLAGSLRALAQSGAGLLVTTSRRTHGDLLDAVVAATASAQRLIYTGGEPNRYGEFLAHADGFVVTGDSINMTGEAAATGRPIHVFLPAGGRDKFRRFHAGLEARGITRPLPQTWADWAGWSYDPLDSTGAIAAEIARRHAVWSQA